MKLPKICLFEEDMWLVENTRKLEIILSLTMLTYSRTSIIRPSRESNN